MPFYLLLAILIFAPLAYGSTGPVAMLVVQGASLFGLAWVCLATLRGGGKFYRPPGLLPLCLLGVLMLLQMLPLPPGLLGRLSPMTAQRYGETIWLLQPDLWMPLSVNLQRTLEAFSYYLSCLAFYLFATQCLAHPQRLKLAVRVVAGFAGLYALLSILEALIPNGQILWVLRPWPDYAGKAFGSYINGNHFAGLMGMLLPVTVMLFLVDKPVVQYGTLKERLIDFCSDPRMGTHLLTGFAALLMAVAIFLSLSRGGILSTLGALLILSLLLAWHRQHRRQALVLIGFVVVAFFFIGMFGWEPVFTAFARIRNLQGDLYDARLSFWSDFLVLFRDFPLFGTGFGSFVDSYSAYQTIYMGEKMIYHAHNDYLELFTEAGLSGLILALWAAYAVLRDSWQAFGRRRQPFAVSLYLGCLAGLSALLLHSLTDFNLHIGANGLYFAFLAALLVACAFTSNRRGTPSELPGAPRRQRGATLAVAVLVLTFSLYFNLSGLLAEAALAPFADRKVAELDSTERETALQSADQAISWAPLNSAHHYFAAKLLQAAGDSERSWQAYGRVLHWRPLSSFYLHRAAVVAHDLQKTELEGALLKAGAQLDRADPRRGRPYASWLLKNNQEVAAFAEIERALAMAPLLTRSFIDVMLVNRVSSLRMSDALPERAQSWLIYANFLVEIKRGTFAESAYRKAMYLAVSEEPPSVAAHWAFYKFLDERQRYDEALAVIVAALDLMPGNPGLHSTAGVLYEKQEIDYRAKEEYRQALLLNPKLKWVKARLERLEGGKL